MISIINSNLTMEQMQPQQLQHQQTRFEQQSLINKCSSYIDSNKKHCQLANIIMNKNSLAAKNSKNNLKKFRQCISNKFKKLINLKPDEFRLNELEGKTGDKAGIKLVNFNYRSNFVIEEVGETAAPRRLTSLHHQTESQRTYMVNRTRLVRRSGSNGHSSRSSLSSGSSTSSIETPWNQVETSTPIQQLRASRTGRLLIESIKPIRYEDEEDGEDKCDRCSCKLQQRQQTYYDAHESLLDASVNRYADQSTQVPVDSPVLIESTFDSSSLSNLSDDLIILQTATMDTPSRNGADWNQIVMDKFSRNSHLNQLPDWAVNTNLSIALADQFYYAQGLVSSSNAGEHFYDVDSHF